MLLPESLFEFCRAFGSRFKRVVVPLKVTIVPKLDLLEDRCLMAANLFAIGSPAGELPLVKIFDSNTGLIIDQFQPFSSAFTGGVKVVLADLNQNGQDDLIVAEGPASKGNHLKSNAAQLAL